MRVSIFTPAEYIGPVMELLTGRRGVYERMDYLDPQRVVIEGKIPLAELIIDFYDQLKSRTRGYASLDYSFDGYQAGDLVRLDILVNNAGTLRDGLVVRMRLEDWRRVLDTNLTGTFLCTREALRDMLRARWGRIVNVTSVVGLVGNAGQANYVAAKAGIVGFTKAVAREVASRNITVNAVAPGYVHSRMTEALEEDQRRWLTAQIPLGRTGLPEEIAPAVVFLCSDQAAYITGQVLNVDGGMVMK
ncbi:MAG: beta-ketoacyl-ACP reductase [candidate division GAL15 bacterium]